MNRAVYAAVIAAGQSRRFGASKQLLEVGGEALVRRACRLATETCGERALLVCGHDRDRVIAASGHSFFIVNEDYEDGMASSIAAAARALSHVANALLVLLVDQPGVDAGLLGRLIREQSCHPGSIAITTYADTAGPPVVFPRAAFDELMALDGDSGAKSVVESGHYGVRTLRCDAAGFDIDTPDDLPSA